MKMRTQFKQIAPLLAVAALIGGYSTAAHSQQKATTGYATISSEPKCIKEESLDPIFKGVDRSALNQILGIVVCEGGGGIGKAPPQKAPEFDLSKTKKYCEERFTDFEQAFEDFNNQILFYDRGSHRNYELAFSILQKVFDNVDPPTDGNDTPWLIVRNALIRGGKIHDALEQAMACNSEKKSDETLTRIFYKYGFFLEQFAREAEIDHLCRGDRNRCPEEYRNRHEVFSEFESMLKYHRASLIWLNRAGAVDSDSSGFSSEAEVAKGLPIEQTPWNRGVFTKIPVKAYLKMAELVTYWALEDLVLKPSGEWPPYSCALQRLNDLHTKLVKLNGGAMTTASQESSIGQLLGVQDACEPATESVRLAINSIYDDIEDIAFQMGDEHATDCRPNRSKIFDQHR
jgi:hypothetical protein